MVSILKLISRERRLNIVSKIDFKQTALCMLPLVFVTKEKPFVMKQNCNSRHATALLV